MQSAVEKRDEHVFQANNASSSHTGTAVQRRPERPKELDGGGQFRHGLPHTPYLLSGVLLELAADFSSKF